MTKEDYYLLSDEERAEVKRLDRVLTLQIEKEWTRLGKNINGVEFQMRALPYADDMSGFLDAIRRGDFGKPKDE